MEYWDIVDENGRFLYTAPADIKCKHGEYQFAAEVWPVNPHGEILIQKRSLQCPILPGVWGLTTGRIQSGETTAQGAVRELREELGLSVPVNRLIFLERIIRRDETHLIWDIFTVKIFAEISSLQMQTSEVEQALWVPPSKFLQMVKNGDLNNYPELEQMLQKVTENVKTEKFQF